ELLAQALVTDQPRRTLVGSRHSVERVIGSPARRAITMVSTLALRPDTDPTADGGRTLPGGGRAAKIELSGVTKRFVSPTGALHTAIRDVELVIEPGQFCAIV